MIGGGLTAIDTATEMQAYYVVQVEKALDRYERLLPKIGEEAIWAKLDGEEREIIETWLKHGRAVRAERLRRRGRRTRTGLQSARPELGAA